MLPVASEKKTVLQDVQVPRLSCTVEEGLPPQYRLDVYISEKLKLLTRSQIKARHLRARLNGKEVKISRNVKAGDSLELFWEDAQPLELVPEDLPLDIVYENERVAVVNKAQGMVVHPGAGNHSGTLANVLYFHALKRFPGTERSADRGLRPGIVHRLDKDTSGLIITAWDEDAHAFLAEQFKKRKVIKTYAAIVQGSTEKSGRIETLLCRSRRNRKLFAVSRDRGKASLTLYKTVRSWGSHSLVLLRPRTGRTHQLRVHLEYLGHPIVGDSLYGKTDLRFPDASLMLHAKRLSIVLPGNKTRTGFSTGFPLRFNEMISMLNRCR